MSGGCICAYSNKNKRRVTFLPKKVSSSVIWPLISNPLWRERPRLRRHSWHRMPPRSRTCRAPTRKSTFRTLSATACWPKGASHLKKKRGEVEMGAGCVYSPGNFGSERCDRGLPSCFFEHYFQLRRDLEKKIYLPTPHIVSPPAFSPLLAPAT